MTTNSDSLLDTAIPTQVLIPPAPSPYGRFASIKQWYSRSEQTSETAEARLLSRLQFFSIGGKTVATSKESKTIARVGLVDLDGDGKRMINTLVIDQNGNDFAIENGNVSQSKNLSLTTNELGYSPISQTQLSVQSNTTTINDKPSTKNLVICHGYGAGLGFFYRNYHDLSQVPGWRIYSIDWLGMGRSSRPKFTIKSHTFDESVEETEKFFVDSLEKWRQLHNIEKMTLLGHSLGGYLSAVYALKYPDRVERLILVSPGGIPEITDGPEAIKNRIGPTMFNVISNLWNADITPQLIMRWAGPFGPSLVNRYTTRRFAYLDEQDQFDLHDYLYNISSTPGSGEFALSRIFAPGAFARKPLINRLPNLKMPTTFLYGQQDWMDYRAAVEASKKMKVPTKVIRIQDAGHHLYLDNPIDFNKAIVTEMLETSNV
ncbi:alpha/beta-hydrolase [Gigaspora margarita]|uniref:Alpha/beta-hydrolase n=3 Tax=Gigaspora margarita TaxID=4874 RepID=A0A8H4EIR6_GIGMA|nr:alpha/beta-hydrolase [Gigaspora margarita]